MKNFRTVELLKVAVSSIDFIVSFHKRPKNSIQNLSHGKLDLNLTRLEKGMYHMFCDSLLGIAVKPTKITLCA